MKKLILLLIGLVSGISIYGQDLIKGEYFFDVDPGFGMGFPITFAPTDSLSLDSLVINTSGLSLGHHYLYIRKQNSDGVWGFTQRERIYIYEDQAEPSISSKIVSGEYYFDQDPGPGNGVPFVFTPSDSISLNFEAAALNLSAGPHKLFVRVKDSLGFWSFPYSIAFDVCSTYSPLAGFEDVQYGSKFSFIDNSKYGEQYYWDFDDGVTDSSSNPTHKYSSPGVYEIKQIVTNGCGSDSSSKLLIYNGLEDYHPKVVGDSGWVTVHFYGGFQNADSITVSLSRTGQPNIVAPDSMIKLFDNSHFSASFFLSNPDLGAWDIAINLVNDTSYFIPSGLEIEKIRQNFEMYFTLPREARRLSVPTLLVSYTNLGNVDAEYPTATVLSYSQNNLSNTRSIPDSTKVLDVRLFSEESGLVAPGISGGMPFYTRMMNSNLHIGMISNQVGFGAKTALGIAISLNCKARWNPFNPNNVCTGVPDIIFTSACQNHDECYASCNADKFICDMNFKSDMFRACDENWFMSFPAKSCCYKCAQLYFNGVTIFGEYFFNNAQDPATCVTRHQPRRFYFPQEIICDDICIKCDSTDSVNSFDPNNKNGISGYGLENYINRKNLSFRIDCENVDTATANVIRLLILDTLDISKFDAQSFAFGPFSIGDSVYQVPPFRKEYTTIIDLRNEEGIFLKLNAKLNEESGIVRWEFIALDTVSQNLVNDLRGFLSPNINSPEGEGMVSFSINLKDSLPHNTEIKNRASIIFDQNDAIITNYWSNKLDLLPPNSSVTTLPPLTPHSSLINDSLLIIYWSGSDQGAGIVYYDVYVSVGNDTAFTKWLSLTPATHDTLVVEPGETYRFYSIAYDGVGNVEVKSPLIEAQTTVDYLLSLPPNSFSGFLRDDNTVLLNWEVEISADYQSFEIHRSQNGEDFTLISQVVGKENQTIYQLIDSEPFWGKNYYRLKLVNHDGSSIYSKVIEVLVKKSIIKIFPNPTEGPITISAQSETEELTWEIWNIYGNQVLKGKTIGESKLIDLSDFADGVYLLKVQVNGNIVGKKIFKLSN